MIPLLLLQITLFQQYAQEASLRVGVPFVQVMPVTVGPSQSKLLAWVWRCHNPGIGCGLPIVYIATDVPTTASPAVLRYLAYHEVCHLKLGHNLFPTAGLEVHGPVRVCIWNALGPSVGTGLEAQMTSYSQLMWRVRRNRFAP